MSERNTYEFSPLNRAQLTVMGTTGLLLGIVSVITGVGFLDFLTDVDPLEGIAESFGTNQVSAGAILASAGTVVAGAGAALLIAAQRKHAQ